MKRILVALLILIGITSFTFAADYNYVSIKGLIEQEVGREIIPKIYEKLGYTVTITPLPGKRAQLEATSGTKDGEIMRIYTYGENNPTVVRVETPYYYLETMGFIKEGSGIVIKSKADLARHKLVKVRGVKHTDNITAGLSNVTDINDTEQMMRFLRSGRADVALTNTVDGLLVLDKLGYDNIVPIEKPLAVLDLYHYIHEKHKALVPKVNAVVKEMKESGELDKIIKSAEARVIERFK
jgi:ABC-type amino acid transport substrate-binding protein